MSNLPHREAAVNRQWPDHLVLIAARAIFAKEAGAHPRSIAAQMWRRLRGLEAAGGLSAIEGVKVFIADATLPVDIRQALGQVLELVQGGQVAS